MSYSLQSHGLQHARLPCPSLTPRICSNLCPLSRWCHPTISSSVVPFSSCPQSFPVSEFFSQLNQVAKVVELQLQHLSFRIGWFDLLPVQGILKSLLQCHSLKASIFHHRNFLMVQFSHWYMTIGKTIALTIWIFVDKVLFLLFNTLPRFVTAFPPRRKCLLISLKVRNAHSAAVQVQSTWLWRAYAPTLGLFDLNNRREAPSPASLLLQCSPPDRSSSSRFLVNSFASPSRFCPLLTWLWEAACF